MNALYNEVALGRWVERKVLELKITPLVGAILRAFSARVQDHRAGIVYALRRRVGACGWIRGCDR